MKRFVIPPRVYLPLLIFVAVMMLGLRIGDVWTAVSTGRALAPVATVQAEEKKEASAAKPEEKKTEEKKPEEKKADEKTDRAPPKEVPATPEGDLLKQLSGRRDQLDKREQDLDTREALIRVGEQRVEQKLKEMETLRAQLQTLVGQANAAQQAQLENLVKIYETMKPKEAAKIFETMEMPVLLGVVQKMKPQRTAAVLAEMNPQKAKDVTVALTRQDQLPQIK